VLAVLSAGTGVWSFVLLTRTPDWLPALRWVVLAGAVVFAVMLAFGAQLCGRCPVVVAAGAILFAVAAPAAYTIETVATSHDGSVSMSGPDKGSSFGRHDGLGGRGGPSGRIADNAALAELVAGLVTVGPQRRSAPWVPAASS